MNEDNKKDREMTDEEKLTAERNWFHLFKDMIKNGEMADMECGALRVYLVVKAYTDIADGTSIPPISLIAEKAGITERYVLKSLRELEDIGYVVKNKDGKGNVYSFREKITIYDPDADNQAIAHASFEYKPRDLPEALLELKNVLVTGKLVDGKLVVIEHLVLNVANGQSAQTNNFNNTITSDEFEKLTPEIQASLLSLKKKLKKK